ncbi:hypothetical protein PHYBLDRAFT_178980 [Phycomyces blakesleeanus NRRL 1555(-)]|uniref:F-box domain-containing protein n=2 Tax=Phycomyces blakesleeanus TaxID=4837 RepID=A0A162Y987_PHYB8|nr:hypothetical protein PHYBLDRAFT_178980 [Phycomyces blakesleeanus NRRL 1555(-)]OAD79125.1 hypothetical protein PHYBLDRAFT_178980 [Phycomyces blakesleeanus NRRL 1555(-)]|eukprot:XP_018297165.1 hypothetical protein PHYBLDRAFT_178980 [Phycomyces blakesleeanus NRRL 1555(-)]
MFSRFPFEILTTIALLISQEDKLNCSAVCKAWRRPFQDSLWNSVEINSMNIDMICDSSPYHQRLFKTNGHRVRSMVLGGWTRLNSKQILKLQYYFPHLKSLSIQDKSLSRNDFGKATDWCHWGSLTRLEIILPSLEHKNLETYFLDVVGSLPCLEYLDMSEGVCTGRYLYTWRDFETLHEKLPRLEHLRMKVSLAPILVNDVLEIQDTKSAPSLSAVHLFGETMDPQWLYYCALKYPNIHTFEWKIFYGYDTAHERMTDTMYAAMGLAMKMISSLPSFFPHLKKAIIEEISDEGRLHTLFWKKLRQSGASLAQLEYHVRGEVIAPYQIQTILRECSQTCSDTLETLQLQFYTSDSYLCMAPISLGTFPCLVNLTINLLYNHFELDVILDNCINLKKLKLQNGTSSISHGALKYPQQHGLQTFELVSVRVNLAIFRHLSYRCQQLRHLELATLRIAEKICSKTGNLLLDMPFTQLETLKLCDLVLYSEKDDYSNPYYYDNDSTDSMDRYHQIQLFVIEQTHTNPPIPDSPVQCHAVLPTSPPTSPHPQSPSQSPITKDTTWFHRCLGSPHNHNNDNSNNINNNTPSQEIRVLEKEQVETACKYFQTFQAQSQEEATHSDIERDEDGLVLEQYWQKDLPEGYITLRCKSVDQYSIEGLPDHTIDGT